MFDHVNDVIKTFIETIEHVHDQCLVAHGSLNVLEKVRY